MTTPNTDVVNNIICNIYAAITLNSGEHTKAIYAKIDAVENVLTPTEDEVFWLSDVK
jgi:hypothetical protein